MKSLALHLKTVAITCVLIFFQTFATSAQTSRIEDFIKAGREDAEVLTKAYLKPLPNGIGGSINTGWFNSASTHQTYGFDIQIRGALAFIPSADQSFDLNTLDLQQTRPADPNDTISPTAGGVDEPGPEVVVEDNGEEVTRFNLPQGSGFEYVPSAMVQATVGLIKKTDIMVRFVPKVNYGDYGDFQMTGFGVKHSLSQWLPGIFPLNISVMAGYNRVDLSANLNLKPEKSDPNTNYDNQKVTTKFDTFTAKLIVGKDLSFISLYAATGYETSTMHLDVTGNYPVEVIGPGGTTQTETITDPFSYTENGSNKFSLTGGLKFKLLFFHVFGEYTLADYPIANAGIGFSFR